MAALFKRNDKTTIAELEEYYANQRSNRSGRAWMMALLSLLITVAVIAALFFWGRWLYRTLTDNGDEAATNDTAQNDDTALPSFDGDLPGGSANTPATEGDSTANGATDEPEPDGVVSDEAATTEGNSTGGEVARTGDDSELPNTGAGEILILLPAVAGITGYAVSRRRQLQK